MNKANKIIIKRIFDSPKDQVFKAWTMPEYIKKWWAPKGFTSPFAKVDLREGGKYLFCMKGPDGKEYWSGGKYTQIIENKKLVVVDSFTDKIGNIVEPEKYGMSPNFPRKSKVTINFDEHKGKTTLTILYEPETMAAKNAMINARMIEGWNSSLDKLEEVVG